MSFVTRKPVFVAKTSGDIDQSVYLIRLLGALSYHRGKHTVNRSICIAVALIRLCKHLNFEVLDTQGVDQEI